ncbi:hypothetical protein J9332_43275, partial [Aquimarina celericrescens]|nr:hypothetical protein [Aquimarina celericrescens]
VYVPIVTFPLSRTGKIDRTQLPLITLADIKTDVYAAPENKIEEKLVEIWKEVLSFTEKQIVNAIPLDVSFFEIGGDSLRAGLIA